MSQTQFDHSHRIVALNNLEAICKRISGVAHRFHISKVTPHRVYVEYSNPDEYGSPEPITAVYACYPQHNNTAVVLDAIDYKGCTGKNEEAWQAFWELTDHAPLFRSQTTDGVYVWETEYEILVKGHPEFAVSSSWDSGGCIQTWHCKDQNFKSWVDAQAWAVAQIKLL